jgi:hypothetical protein
VKEKPQGTLLREVQGGQEGGQIGHVEGGPVWQCQRPAGTLYTTDHDIRCAEL